MSVSDPVADFITVIRNASKAKKSKVMTKSSKLLNSVCEILKTENYIENYKPVDEGNKKFVRIHLKYNGEEAAIHHISKVSKPGLRSYIPCKDIPVVLGGLGMSILSTSKGIVSGKTARKSKVGGELLIKVW